MTCLYPVVDASIVGIKRSVAIEDVILRARTRKGGYACFVNAHVSVMTRQNPEVRKAIENASFAFPDGTPVYALGRYLYRLNMDKISGPDFLELIFRHEDGRKLNHYFYGSTSETLNKLVSNLKLKYEGCNIVGVASPPFRELTEEEEQSYLDAIFKSGAQIVWIGLGAPKQELWMYHNASKLPNHMLMGVGAAFDFHAGVVQRAPNWLRNTGFEWLHRLSMEPRRLWKRYLSTNLLFIYFVLLDALKKLLGRSPKC